MQNPITHTFKQPLTTPTAEAVGFCGYRTCNDIATSGANKELPLQLIEKYF